MFGHVLSTTVVFEYAGIVAKDATFLEAEGMSDRGSSPGCVYSIEFSIILR